MRFESLSPWRPAASAGGLAAAQHLAVIVPMAVGMGLQNATVAQIALPTLGRTFLTATLVSFAANLRFSHLESRKLIRPALAVVAMLAGATCGALLVLRINLAAGLGLALGILVVVCWFALVRGSGRVNDRAATLTG